MIDPLLARFSTERVLVAPEKRAWFESCLTALSRHEKFEALQAGASADDGFWPAADDWRAAYRPYVVRDGVLQIPVKGVLLHDFPWAFGSRATGYVYIRRAFERGMADPAVNGIALICDSPGGQVAGCFELVDAIHARRGEKPIRAFAHESAYSAAYAIASVADQVVVSRTGGVGSIGVVTAHLDVSGAMEQAGLKVTFIFAGKHKVDGNAYETLPADVKERWQAHIDEIYAVFVATVARNRNMDEQAVRKTEADCFSATEATSNGLADSIGALDDAVAQFITDLSAVDEEGEDDMTTKDTTTPAATEQIAAARAEGNAEGVTEATAAERVRISAILGSEEAKGRDTLAHHIAFETDMTADAAKAMLGKAPKLESKAPEPNRFDKAMKDAGNPNVGADGEPAGEDAEAASEASAIVATIRGKAA